ncbi:MAG TPA: MMPL family transporter, partial [Acidimicrobiales bacterium]|nr:MMPL family transporter [Acidimicrobiales bacterium]
ARMGRWSARHRKTAIWGWIAFVAIAFVIGNAVGTQKPDHEDYIGQSGQAAKLFDSHYPKKADEQVIVQAPKGGHATDASVRKAVADTIAAVSGKPGVTDVQSPYSKGNEGQISKDGRSVLVEFSLKGDDDATQNLVGATTTAIDKVKADNPSVFVGQFGAASGEKAITKAQNEDSAKSMQLSLPLTLLILLATFGALVAAGIPLLLGITAVFATLGLVGPVSHLVPMDDTVTEVVLLVGLAVGVDYSLFYLRREREERARGASKMEAVHTAAASSGRAVLIAGSTVMIAMAGMFFAGLSIFTALGIGSIMVVAVAMIGSVTVLPAILASLGDRVDKGRIPFMHRLRRSDGDSRVWSWILDKVLRRPAISAVLATGLLVVMALPAFGMHTVLSGTDDYSRKLEVMQVYDRMQAAFPGGQIPAVVAIEAKDVTTPQIAAATKAMGDKAIATGEFNAPLSVDVSPDKHLAMVSIPMQGDGTDKASVHALETLRGGIVDSTVGQAPGVEHAYVTGEAAGTKDFNDLLKSKAPIVFAFVLTLAFVLLLVTFRSIVIPIKAIVLNLLSVGAAYGVLTWIFQDGHLQGLLNFKSVGGITSWLPLFLFVILFGLSMDYHVFIVSRIKEAVDGGQSTDEAVSHGIKSTAGVVTSAAVVMVAVFAIFATLGLLDFKMMGVGLAVAVLLDATIVRAVLLPAAMVLLGERNWYLPRALGFLPRVDHERLPPLPLRTPTLDRA